MKEEFFYRNGKIEAIDDKVLNKTIKYDYQDNIEEILKTENILEDLCNREKELINMYKKNYDKYLKKNKLIFIIFSFIACIFTIFSLALVALIPSLIVLLLFLSEITIMCYLPFNKTLNIISDNYTRGINGIQLELKKISEKISEKEVKLMQLKLDKKNDNEEKIKEQYINKVNYIDELKEIKNYLELYYKIGYCENEYDEYYKNGVLDKKLENKFTSNEKKLIKKYFDEKNKIN